MKSFVKSASGTVNRTAAAKLMSGRTRSNQTAAASPFKTYLKKTTTTAIPAFLLTSTSSQCSPSSFLVTTNNGTFLLPVNLSSAVEDDDFDRRWHAWLIPLLTLFAILTTCGNGVIAFSILSEKALRTSTNFCLVSLSFADFLVGAVVMPLATSQEWSEDQWLIGSFSCNVFQACDVMASTCSILNLCLISHNRYMAIAKPLIYNTSHRRKMYVALGIGATWLASIAIAAPLMLGINDLPNGSHSMVCAINNGTYAIYLAIITFFLPSIAIAVQHIFILRALVDRARHIKLRVYTDSKQQTPVMGPAICDDVDDLLEDCDRVGALRTPLPLTPPSDTDDDDSVDSQSTKVGPSPPHQPITNTFSRPTTRQSLDITPRAVDRAKRVSSSSTGSGSSSRRHTLFSGAVNKPAKAPQPPKSSRFRRNSQPAPPTIVINMRRPANLLGGDAPCPLIGYPPLSPSAPGKRALSKQTSPDGQRSNSVSVFSTRFLREDRAIAMLFMITVGFLTCWLPYFVATVINGISEQLINPFVMDFLRWVGHVNSLFNPIFYGIFNKEFRIAVWRRITLQPNLPTSHLTRAPSVISYMGGMGGGLGLWYYGNNNNNNNNN